MPESAAPRRVARAENGRSASADGTAVRFPGVHVRTDVFAENRPGTPGAAAMLAPGPSQNRFGLRAPLCWSKPDSNLRSLLRLDRSFCDMGMPQEAKRTGGWPPKFLVKKNRVANAGGLVCGLEMLRALVASQALCDVVFTANSGHELGHLGFDDFMSRRPGLEVAEGPIWVHYGANIGAARRHSAAGSKKRFGPATARRSLPIRRALPFSKLMNSFKCSTGCCGSPERTYQPAASPFPRSRRPH